MPTQTTYLFLYLRRFNVVNIFYYIILDAGQEYKIIFSIINMIYMNIILIRIKSSGKRRRFIILIVLFKLLSQQCQCGILFFYLDGLGMYNNYFTYYIGVQYM